MIRGIFMAYFLKKSKTNKGIYLQIYESFYDPLRNATAHHSIKPIGYLSNLISDEIPDPIEYYCAVVSEMNFKVKQAKAQATRKQISDISPQRHLGYLPLKNINDSLKVDFYIGFLQRQYNFEFDAFSLMSSLVYARAVDPCSKYKTYHDVLPLLFEANNFSINQLYAGVEFLGSEYERIIEIYNNQIRSKFSYDTSTTYFDCTNFYFEIDQEDDFKRKGPSKENRKDPIVGLGLLLDANQIPIGMKVFPGNQSEKPVLKDVIADLKRRHNIVGKTIQVADKGLNCAENIFSAKKNGDGYIFSKSVKMLPEVEKVWVLLDTDYQDIKDNKGNVLYRIKQWVDKFPYIYSDESGKHKILLSEKRVVIFNPQLAKKKRLEINKQVEKAQLLNLSKAKKSEYGETSKYVVFQSTSKGEVTDDRVAISLNLKAIKKDLLLAGYNMIVSSETHMSAQDIYSGYHNLWRIEESFKLMKTHLDARPVFLQKQERIIGHFLICYLGVLLIRLFQFKVLKNKYPTEDIIKFIRNFNLVQISDKKYINMMKISDFNKDLSSTYLSPVTSYYLSEYEIKMMLNHKI